MVLNVWDAQSSQLEVILMASCSSSAMEEKIKANTKTFLWVAQRNWMQTTMVEKS